MAAGIMPGKASKCRAVSGTKSAGRIGAHAVWPGIDQGQWVCPTGGAKTPINISASICIDARRRFRNGGLFEVAASPVGLDCDRTQKSPGQAGAQVAERWLNQ